MVDQQSVDIAWNDPTLEACEGATCPCGHEALDHAWHGCEACACKRSGIHAVLASGAVSVSVIPSEPRCACGAMTLATTVSENHARGLHGADRCIGGWPLSLSPESTAP